MPSRPSSHAEDPAPTLELCSECGAPIDPETWTPVEVDVDGEMTVIHQFCDEDCQSAWTT